MGDKTRQDLRIAYVCDGGAKLGLGHISRGRALLEIAPGFLVVGEGYTSLKHHLQGTEVRSWEEPALPFAPDAAPTGLVVVDNYELPEDWIAAVAQRCIVAVVDDWRRPHTAGHFVVNPNVGAKVDFYTTPSTSHRLCGPQYALVASEFRESSRVAPDAGRVLITLGGGDSSLSLASVIEAVASRAGDHLLAIDVVLGPASSVEPPTVDRRYHHLVAIHKKPPNFLELCSSAEIVICSASTTSHEMACLGVAFVPVVTAENQVRTGLGWEEAGVAPFLTVENHRVADGIGEEVASLLDDRRMLVARASAGPRIVDGVGPHRIAQALALH